MNRAPSLTLTLLLLGAGCQLPAERMPPRLLPEDGPPLPYAELLTRARLQATAATEAFYVNKWSDLDEAAAGLAQTARFLEKATDVPARHKDTLPIAAGDLGKDAAALREAAKAQDVKKAGEVLQRIHLKIRELRLEG
ncbi:MAG TPA: hypothetical protein VNK04_23255 [Gemmataceae bacterium]|jgi:hypothetical protein|nr:hypothetical protein [Gemmataceae bacterium]